MDIIGDAPVTRYEQAFKVLYDDTASGALLFIPAPTAVVATVLDHNERMLKLAKQLGFEQDRAINNDDGTRGIFLPLT